jgi:hypothetical protein
MTDDQLPQPSVPSTPASDEPKTKSFNLPTWAWIAISATTLVVGVGIGFGISSSDDDSAADGEADTSVTDNNDCTNDNFAWS